MHALAAGVRALAAAGGGAAGGGRVAAGSRPAHRPATLARLTVLQGRGGRICDVIKERERKEKGKNGE